MAMDKINGESIEGLGEYRVVPNGKWWDTKLFNEAAEAAAEQFAARGAIIRGFDDTQVLMQEYPDDSKLLMLFEHAIHGELHYVPFIWDIPPRMAAELATLGKWQLPAKDIN